MTTTTTTTTTTTFSVQLTTTLPGGLTPEQVQRAVLDALRGFDRFALAVVGEGCEVFVLDAA